jgi:hypothetical protein
MAVRFAVVWLTLMTCATYALDEGKQHMSGSNLISRHQRCVLEAFARNAKDAHDFDPNLLDKSVDQCEALLEPLKKSIIARTRDLAFAEAVLTKIRSASKRGVAIALAGYLARGNEMHGETPHQ